MGSSSGSGFGASGGTAVPDGSGAPVGSKTRGASRGLARNLDRGTVLADGEPRAVMSDPAVVHAYLGRSGARA